MVFIRKQSIYIKAAMNLHEWNLNSFESLEFIPGSEKSTASDTTNVLGLS